MAWETARLKALVTLAALWVVAGGSDVFACGVNWMLPRDHFDGVNEYGFVSYWEQIGAIDLGDNLKLPLIIGFQSDRDWSSPYLGKGWILPLLDSNIVQVSENEFRQIQPDGYTINFGRDGKNPNVIHGQQGWTGEIRDDVITLYASCGWKLTYQQGKLTSIITPKNRVLSLLYSDGKVTELREQGHTLLQVNTNPTTKQVNGVTCGKERIGIELGDRPKVEVVAGQNVVGDMQKSLGELHFSDGTKHSYQFAVDDHLRPTLKTELPSHAPRIITWDAADRHIIGDGQWTYSIKGREASNVDINRTNDKNQTESWFYNNVLGEETIVSKDGREKKKTWFVSGMLAGKIRSIVVKRSTEKVSSIDYAYDERGNKIRIATKLNNGWQSVENFEADGSSRKYIKKGNKEITQYKNENGDIYAQFVQ